MNAKEEFLGVIAGRPRLIAAQIRRDDDFTEETFTLYNLKKGYTPEEYQQFLDSLDFNYDNSYGTQYLKGTIWLERNWLGRAEYDGSEWWEYYERPKMPIELLK